ncbi:hypothetical protein E4U54_007968 [Claviceps lovelessii]|nr:hypothetical protein E4U54_007968 [Claviceps lovelessii]
MRSSLLLLLPVWTGSLVSATPIAAAAAADIDCRSDCVFSDAAQAIAQKGKCSTITLKNMNIPAGKTLDLNNLNDGTHVIFSGKTTFGYAQWQGPLISIAGKNIIIEGAPGSIIDCDGKRWWSAKASSKPQFMNAHNLINSQMKGLNILNTPVHAIGISASTNLAVSNIKIDNSLGDKYDAHNTDGFDIGTSTGISVTGCQVRNQDDCFAINSGTNITIRDNSCIGGHGISIGSVGGRSDNTVKDVHVSNCKIADSLFGVRIKTIAGATGLVTDVTYDNIALTNIKQFGIVIRQDYKNSGPTGNPTKGVPIKNLVINRVTGTVKPDGTNYHILCASGACSNWKWTNNKVVNGVKAVVNNAVPAGVVL